MVLSEIDRHLLDRCLQRKPRAWEDFVDRFMGLVVHVVNHCAQARSIQLGPADRDDLCAEILLNLVKDDFGVLRHFRGQASLATYLTVVARRIAVHELMDRKASLPLGNAALVRVIQELAEAHASPDLRLDNREEIERLLEELNEDEARIVRLYHLEDKTYQEISAELGVPENSVGPMLSRARAKLRRAAPNQPAR